MNEKDCGASPKRQYRLQAEPGTFGATMIKTGVQKAAATKVTPEEAAKILLAPVATEKTAKIARAVLKAYQNNYMVAAQALARHIEGSTSETTAHIEAVLRRESK